jgi:hypothetical protein
MEIPVYRQAKGLQKIKQAPAAGIKQVGPLYGIFGFTREKDYKA